MSYPSTPTLTPNLSHTPASRTQTACSGTPSSYYPQDTDLTHTHIPPIRSARLALVRCLEHTLFSLLLCFFQLHFTFFFAFLPLSLPFLALPSLSHFHLLRAGVSTGQTRCLPRAAGLRGGAVAPPHSSSQEKSRLLFILPPPLL